MGRNVLKSITAACMALFMLFAFIPVGHAFTDAISQSGNPSLYNALVSLYPGQVGVQHTNYITVEELAALGSPTTNDVMDLTNRGIVNLAGLSYCANIDVLYLGENTGLNNTPACNLSALSAMTWLKELDLHKNTGLTDMTFLNNLTNLESLDLSACTGMTSLPSFSASFTKLKSLRLNGYLPQNTDDTKGSVMNIAGMTNLNTIASLPMFRNTNSDFYVSLNISNTNVTNASFLNSCAGLKRLYWKYMSSAPVTFPTSANLFYLDLGFDTTLGNSALSSIASIPSFASHNTIAGATWATLSISATGISNVSSLSTAAGLSSLYWQSMYKGKGGTTFSLTALQAQTLADLDQVTSIDLGNDMGLGNSALDTIADMESIQTVGIGNCGITDLNSISAKTGITSLAMGGNKITSLAPLKNMSGLNSLIMNSNYVSDLSPLIGKPITRIDCSQNYLDTTPGSTDMQVLNGLPATGGNKNYANAFGITIHYNPNMAGIPSIPDGSVYYEQQFTPPALKSTYPAQTFLGWDADASDGTAHLDVQSGQTTAVTLNRPIYPGDPQPSNEITYTAVYGYNILASASNAAYGSVMGGGAYQSGTNATLKAQPNTGYHFVRWTEGGIGVSESAEYTVSVSGTHTFTAEFAPNAYTVAFKTNGGTRTGGGELTQVTEYGNTVIAPQVTKAGYGLAGWYKEAAFVNGWDFNTDKVTGDLMLYAKWSPNVLTAVFNDQNGHTASQTVYFGGFVAKPADPVKSGYTFAGWYKEANCVSVWNFNMDVVKDNITLFAKWAKNYTANKLPATVTAGTAIAVKPSSVPQGYTLQSMICSSGNPLVAKANSTGMVAFLKGGKVKITVKMIFQKAGVTKTTIIKKQITVKQQVASVTLNISNTQMILAAKKPLKLKAVISPSSATNKKLKWASSNKKVAVVSGSGEVKAKGKGTAVITCTALDGSKVSSSCTVTVN